MEFADYTRTWELEKKDGMPRCTDGAIGGQACKITISGTEDNVTVHCSNGHFYGLGQYTRDDHKIHSKEDNDCYVLSLLIQVPSPSCRLHCDDEGRDLHQAGSWSAEDTGTTGGES